MSLLLFPVHFWFLSGFSPLFMPFFKDIAGCCEIQMFFLFCQNLRWVYSNDIEYTYILQINNRQRTFAVYFTITIPDKTTIMQCIAPQPVIISISYLESVRNITCLGNHTHVVLIQVLPSTFLFLAHFSCFLGRFHPNKYRFSLD